MDEKITDIYSLDAAQKAAVESIEPRILVSAGPGSGKTAVLSARFVRLLKSGKAPLALTFTNKAAGVMKERISSKLGQGARPLDVCTFHAVSLHILKAELSPFTLIARPEQIRILKSLSIKDPASTVLRISTLKNMEPDCSAIDRRDMEALSAYDAYLRENSLADLDDLVPGVVSLFLTSPDVLKKYSERWTDVLVDEYQDINWHQERLAGLLSKQGSLFCIGDLDQAIYGFRGANLKGFASFEERYPGARVFNLNVNYRSLGRIVEVSSALMAGGGSVACKSISRGGAASSVRVPAPRDEVKFITDEIGRLMGGLTSLTARSTIDALNFSDFAVLARTNRQVEEISEFFKAANVPYKTLLPFPEAGLSDLRVRLAGAAVSEGSDFEGLLRKEAGELGLKSEIVDALLIRAREVMKGEGRVEAFLDSLMLMEPEDAFDIEADKVTIATLHKAKGMEFDTVFIAGVEDGFLPLESAKKDASGIDEERRLFYVGVTRARSRVYFTHVDKRLVSGRETVRRKSPLLDVLPEGLVEPLETARRDRPRKPVQKTLF
jgi:DNA helicase-2/ATP-dependent DNA helicase PcrA